MHDGISACWHVACWHVAWRVGVLHVDIVASRSPAARPPRPARTPQTPASHGAPRMTPPASNFSPLPCGGPCGHVLGVGPPSRFSLYLSACMHGMPFVSAPLRCGSACMLASGPARSPPASRMYELPVSHGHSGRIRMARQRGSAVTHHLLSLLPALCGYVALLFGSSAFLHRLSSVRRLPRCFGAVTSPLAASSRITSVCRLTLSRHRRSYLITRRLQHTMH